ncbi:hypothetical protein LRY65_02415 [Candidatus Woesebacteria bacterium]|nr:hypothetical protein [Candidatus Woesebacteria bacterium]MCD8527047.1 hypothetical protein [Candidatus Woesebacteria bacterium]
MRIGDLLSRFGHESEQSVLQVRELRLSDIKTASSFSSLEVQEAFLCIYMAKALRNPGWILRTWRQDEDRPPVLGVGLGTVQAFRELSELSDGLALQAADNFLSGRSRLPDFLGVNHLIARTLELLSTDFPNMAFYRSGEIQPQTLEPQLEGIDWATGLAEDSFYYYDQGFKGGPRENPGFARLLFSDVVKHYLAGELHHFETEETWDRGVLALHFLESAVPSASIYHLPSETEQRQSLIDEFKKNSLTMPQPSNTG